ncbi:MAG: glycosyltransferase family 9 protein [Verrucomicrobia bacterium]|nr:glycosyltransferase family 9 protein [Verrucomicrobiota bacterium]MDE3099802.1 glycosyltransferase family 9 protein [Verrucomicrobiota bacterium]
MATMEKTPHQPKPGLLVIELWGVGDLAMATPFLRAAAERFEVTLLAKPMAADLQPRLWPGVTVMPFMAPWTAFRGKYRLWKWPWVELFRLRGRMAARQFDRGVSARWDPRDHFLLKFFEVKRRLGFERGASGIFLTDAFEKPEPQHRQQFWAALAGALGLSPPPLEAMRESTPRSGAILIHTGAGRPVRVWPLERYRNLAAWLRGQGHAVQIACDAPQRQWWLGAGEPRVATPQTLSDLLRLIDAAGLFIGNDSGPGHLAATCGLPTFTIFGPQLPEWFAPTHPAAQWAGGKACPYKPCSDHCRFPEPFCLHKVSEEEARERVGDWVRNVIELKARASGERLADQSESK